MLHFSTITACLHHTRSSANDMCLPSCNIRAQALRALHQAVHLAGSCLQKRNQVGVGIAAAAAAATAASGRVDLEEGGGRARHLAATQRAGRSRRRVMLARLQ